MDALAPPRYFDLVCTLALSRGKCQNFLIAPITLVNHEYLSTAAPYHSALLSFFNPEIFSIAAWKLGVGVFEDEPA
jgi:hypothetical protein